MITDKFLRWEYETEQDVLTIKPLIDVHFGNRLCDVSALKNYLSKDDNPNTYFIGIGDLMDMVITQDLKRYRKGMDDSGEHEAVVDYQIDKLYDILQPYAERILLIGHGNHEDSILVRCGTNPSERLANKLNVPYVGYSFLYRIIMTKKNNGGQTRVVVIRAHHGWGGGSRTQGADLTKYSRDVAYWDADIFLYGHVHRRQSDEIPRIGLNSAGKLISRPKYMGICGTFLKTYSDTTTPSYSEKSGYPPVSIGGITINIRPTTKWADIHIEV